MVKAGSMCIPRSRQFVLQPRGDRATTVTVRVRYYVRRTDARNARGRKSSRKKLDKRFTLNVA
jgi:hypothetical protein